MTVYELNIDGLVGPSHHYAGLSLGNIASTSNAFIIANPAAAALQGIHKMRLLHRMGLKQAVLPPHQRPNLHLLQQLGFHGTPMQQIKQAKHADPQLLRACFSASSMWAANAATVSASLDTQDHRVHFTAANLVTNLHRHQEADFSRQLLRRLFANDHYFQHHAILPKTTSIRDEGAANHGRLCMNHATPGINLFIYGQEALQTKHLMHAPSHFPARQTLEASQAIARSHLLNPNQVCFIHQNPAAIDQGVFHNDVIAVANESVLLLHEDAFLHQKDVLKTLHEKAAFPLHILQADRRRISITDAVQSYLFNSQLITLPNQNMALIAPIECQEMLAVCEWIDELVADEQNPITEVHYLDLKQSMQNGGGPACLRLRVPLNEHELSAMHQGVLINDALLNALDEWVNRHYRTQLHADDLDDPSLLDEYFYALDELTQLLKLGSIYPFQLEKGTP